jgi:hypothetical protein
LRVREAELRRSGYALLSYSKSGTLRVRGIKPQRPPKVWVVLREIVIRKDEGSEPMQQLKECCSVLVRTFASLGESVYLRVQGDGNGRLRISFALGGTTLTVEHVVRLVKGAFPQAFVEEDVVVVPELTKTAYISGIPAPVDRVQTSWISVIGRRCLGAKPFVVLVAAAPLSDAEVIRGKQRWCAAKDAGFPHRAWTTSESTSEQTGVSLTGGSSEQKSMPENFIGGSNLSRSTTDSRSTTKGTDESREYEDADFMSLDRHYEHHIERYEQGYSEGMWQTAVYVAAENRADLDLVGSAIGGSLLDGENYFFRLRMTQNDSVYPLLEACFLPDDVAPEEMHPSTTVLTTSELTSYFLPPDQEFPGYGFREARQFNVNVDRSGDLKLGNVCVLEEVSDQVVTLHTNQLTKHALVTGITGSGKTNTIFSLLRNSSVPFLIVEPTKREYRHLVDSVPSLRVYTLGIEDVSPLRLNPFFFPEGIPLQQHLDSLRAIFNASFSMYASMPNILEQCLVRIYLKRGWSLHYSTNVYAQDPTVDRIELYPTLGDLYREIDAYLTASGYADEQKSNIRAALLTRLKSLMTGTKGLLLNTRESLDFGEILRHPTVLELEGVADDDDKALIMGLVFVRLVEQLKLEMPEGRATVPIRHLTVLEEAHRVFSSVSTTTLNPEVANIRGKAVEYFSNMLSEIRAMGEGIIIVDQIPSKLAPDAIKNTNLKIVHRLVAIDDAESMCNALGMEKSDTSALVRLPVGHAIIFQEGLKTPVHAKIALAKVDESSFSDKELRTHCKAYNRYLSTEHIHPFAEVLLEDSWYKAKLMLLAERLLNSFLIDDLSRHGELLSVWHEQIVGLAYQAGLELPTEERGKFIRSVSRVMVDLVCDQNPFFGKNGRISGRVKHFMRVLLDNDEYQWSQNELAVLHLRRADSVYPAIQEAVVRSLVESDTADCLLKNPSPLDGVAYTAAGVLLNSGITNGIDPQIDPLDNLRNLCRNTIREIEQFFLLPSRASDELREFAYRVLLVITQTVNTPLLEKRLAELIREELSRGL